MVEIGDPGQAQMSRKICVCVFVTFFVDPFLSTAMQIEGNFTKMSPPKRGFARYSEGKVTKNRVQMVTRSEVQSIILDDGLLRSLALSSSCVCGATRLVS